MSTKSFGDAGEDVAKKLLINKGYKILTTKFRSKFGEIDIIAKDKDTLVFVEVKTRWSEKYGKPEEAVDSRKLWKIRKAADYYCLVNNCYDKKMRIDVVAMEIEDGRIISQNIITVD